MQAREWHADAAWAALAREDLWDVLESSWPKWVAATEPQASLVAILDDGTLTQLAHVGDAQPDAEAVDIWSDSSWSDFIEAVRLHGPLPHVDTAGRTRVPITDGPILYGALELRARPSLQLDHDTIERITDALLPVLADALSS